MSIITGENGTGKTILLDAIRGLFGQSYATLDRAIWREETRFRLEATIFAEGREIQLAATARSGPRALALSGDASSVELWNAPGALAQGRDKGPQWTVDYWRSIHATDPLYTDKPVEEILLSPAFDGTPPFGDELTKLMARRKEAIERGDTATRRQIEAELQEKNPDYFSYLDVEQRLRELRGGEA